MLQVKSLSVDISGSDGRRTRVVDDISFDLGEGETLGVVGESGSGKTMLALALKPELLIADEPTTALDVTVQKEILDIFDDLVADFGMSLVFISHDIGVIGRIADRTLVMLNGRQMEQGPTVEVLRRPTADYTRTLLAAMPRRTRGHLDAGAITEKQP